MSEMTVYPSGKKAAEENKQPQVIDFEMEAHACGKQKAGNELKEFAYNVADRSHTGVLFAIAGAGYALSQIGDRIIENVETADRRTWTEENFENASNNVGGAAIIGGLGDCATFLALGVLVAKGVKAYENSPAAQKINPVMRKVGAFLSKNAQRAADCVRLTENDTMHKGKYHHTVVPAKDGKMGHTYVNPVKKFMNRFREGY